MKSLYTKLLLLVACVMMGSTAWAEEEIIYSTGFESSEGFTANTTYNNTSVAYYGPSSKQWGTIYGCATTNAYTAGSQGLQMRIYKNQTSPNPNVFTNFSVANPGYEITKIYLEAKTDNKSVFKGFKLQISTDGGESWTDAKTHTFSGTSKETMTYTPASPITDEDVRLRVYVHNFTAGSSTQKCTIDEVKVYGQLGAGAVSVTGISLDKTTASVEVGQKTTLTATIAPADASNKKVTWTSNNDAVATVDNGVVTGVSAGVATITATTADGNFTASCDVTVSAIAVSGITLDQTELNLMATETATLVATIAPANAADKTITWESDNEAVATVADGVITAVHAGTANITATTTDGGFTASCEVTVAPAPFFLAYTFDFTVNNFGLPTSAVKGAEKSYTYDGQTITLYGDASNGFKFSGSDGDRYLIMGKSGAYLTLPAFDFAVAKIVVEGRAGASASTVQNIYVGNTAVSTATTGATGTNTYVINENYRAAGNVYTLKVTSAHNTQITSIKVYGVAENLTIGASCYATLFSDNALTVPTGVTAYTAAQKDANTVTLNPIEDGVIPANTGVVLKAEAADTYTFEATADVYPIEGNLLVGSVADDTATPAGAYALGVKSGTVGFYLYGGVTLTAGKAYLVLPSSASVIRVEFADEEGISTGVGDIIDEEDVPLIIHTLKGRLVKKVVKDDFYIVNMKSIEWLEAQKK